MTDPQPASALLAALDEIDAALADNVERSLEIQRRVQHYRESLVAGADLEPLVTAEDAPRTVELLSANAHALETAGAAWRAQLAQGLRDEGLTIEAIAELFGVTRQRISALLKQLDQ